LYATGGGSDALPTLKWLLKEGGARITERDHEGYTALLLGTMKGNFTVCQWLLEHGGANIAETADNGRTVWTMLGSHLFEANVHIADDVTALLRVMVVRGAPSADFELVADLSQEHVRVLEEGAKLRAALPAYLARRQALLHPHCPLIPPLLALIHAYDPGPTTTEELWATGLGIPW
jgi:hypothetical protein